MTSANLKGMLGSGIVITVIGFILLFFSTTFGSIQADNWLVQQGGADTSIYLVMIKSYINTFLVSGSILFGIGLIITFFSLYKLLNFDGE
ncbi:hypothetical protein [Bacillus andreraoultii]|uniref:hypothetical protein n=1 Tax=Bacillus andreraoultii TaxID=1499685 RepID=UPI00053A8794|nr:hypothetical protein [Bacillus andreraoultii]